MKKKGLLVLMLCVITLLCFGCGKSLESYVEENMAEITKTFYFGENETFYATLSSGQREKEYLLNGVADDVTNFALLSVTFFEETNLQAIKVFVTIGEDKKEVELEYSPLANAFLADLEKFVDEKPEIKISYNNKTIELQNFSSKFVIDWQKALEISVKELKTEIEKEKKYANLNAECYLKVLDKKANKFEDFFWCFTILNVKNESYSVVISTTDGSVLAKTK